VSSFQRLIDLKKANIFVSPERTSGLGGLRRAPFELPMYLAKPRVSSFSFVGSCVQHHIFESALPVFKGCVV
jgi:hypothetical protein